MANFSVTNTNDSGNGSLRHAIAQANAREGADVIQFTGSVFTDGTADTISLTSGQLSITDDLTIAGTGAKKLTISGNNASRVFEVDDEDFDSFLNVEIKGVAIANARSTDNGGAIANQENLTILDSVIKNNTAVHPDFVDLKGGGIFSQQGILTIKNSVVSGNTADEGGAIFNDGELMLVDSTISGNTAKVFAGGGIQNLSGSLIAHNSTISNNSANVNGGGIFAASDAKVELINSVVSGNRAIKSGGGMMLSGGTFAITGSTISNNSTEENGGGLLNEGELTMTDTILSENTAKSFGAGIFNQEGNVAIANSTIRSNRLDPTNGNAGGGIYNSKGTLTVADTTISDNSGRFGGGGIINSLGETTVTNSTISNNTADAGSGGGIDTFAGTLSVTNSTISGNAAGTDGGGINSSLSGLTVINSTITNNKAGASPFSFFANGGGISTNSGGTIQNTIIANNSVKTELVEPSPDVDGSLTVADSNLIGDGTGSDIVDGVNGNLVGTSLSPIDPKLGPLQDNGGSTFTHTLLSGSPAIDRGNSANLPIGLTTDQRGQERISGGTVDIGAVEAKILAGSGGQKTFAIDRDDILTVTDFGGVGKGVNPTTGTIAEADILKFEGAGLTARNILLTQNGANLEISFEGGADTRVILDNFKLENLENLRKSNGAAVDLGNILFDGQTGIQDEFDVFDANETRNSVFNRNMVTFLNDRNNTVKGLDNSNDVINAQGGKDRVEGRSGNDLLRGGLGQDTLLGENGDDVLVGGGDKDTLNGGNGNDRFVHQALSDKGDTITDFNRSKDKLVLTDLFDNLGYGGSNPIADGWLKFEQKGAHTVVRIDSDGLAGSATFSTLATLNNVTATHLTVGNNVLI